MNVCVLCLCAIKANGETLPVCRACYERLAALPDEKRMDLSLRVVEAMQRRRAADAVSDLSGQIDELVAASKSFSPPYRMN